MAWMIVQKSSSGSRSAAAVSPAKRNKMALSEAKTPEERRMIARNEALARVRVCVVVMVGWGVRLFDRACALRRSVCLRVVL